EPPLPGEFFDLIGGTGTGRLIALMLGPLCMSVIEAITAYSWMSEEVFSETKWKGKESTFKASKLEDFIKKIVAGRLGDSQARMLDLSGNDPCKMFVCAMPAHSINPAIPPIFCNYQVPKGATFNCQVWEAAQATTATPTIFKAIKIGEPFMQQLFIDAGIGCNNPIKQVIQEAKLIFSSQHIACILSIGAGHPRTISLARTGGFFSNILPLALCTTMHNLATDCESMAEEIARQFDSIPNFYHHFSVDQGLQNFILGQWHQL
ncbi:hypothetical protein JAAARDRAFT_98007, partial [Jaapia argillacea MUCL 33604]